MVGQPNVVLFVADTTRADDAFDPSVAPTLAELAEAGTRVTRAFSTAPWTLPAHASMLTGSYPSKHGAYTGHERLDGSLPTLPALLGDAGYETVCVSNNTWLSSASGFDRGFDEFRQMWQLVQSDTSLGEIVQVTEGSSVDAVGRKLFEGNPVVNGVNALYQSLVRNRDRNDDGAARSTRWIEHWLSDRSGDRPFFLLANYIEPHLDYRPPRRLAEEHLPADVTYDEAMAVPQEPWEYLAGNVTLSDRELRALRGLYRAEIAAVDEQIAAISEALRETGEWEDTVFVVTADHGENVGDHGMMDHQYCLYDTLVHVPLVVHGGAFTGYGDLTDLVSLVDLAPTLLDAAGVRADDARATFQGRSFHPATHARSREFVVSEYMAPQPSMAALEHHVGDLPAHVEKHDRSLRAIRTRSHALVRGSDGSRSLYDLRSDPGETADVAASNPRTAADLGETLDEWLDSFEHANVDDAVTIDGRRKAQLERLGYLQ
ncbi:sulfatase [Halobacteria archaeon HArc-gm2]|nr:sulfatase [Halobacteria archaeon HArc-gm2]